MSGRINSDFNPKKNTYLYESANIFTKVFGSKNLTSGFETLKKRPVMEVAGLDITTMIIPRTIIDLRQNITYGAEAAFRELSCLIANPFLVGIISNKITAAKGYPKLYANSATIKSLSTAWKEAGGSRFNHENPKSKENFEIVRNYVKTVLNNSEGLVGNGEWKKLSEKQQKRFATRLAVIMTADEKKNSKKIAKLLDKLAENFTNDTGAASSIRVKVGEGFNTDIDKLFRDMTHVGRQVFTKTASGNLDSVIEKICKLSRIRTLVALGITLVAGSSLQYINKTITRLRTGSSEFCAYNDFGKKNSIHQKDKNKSSKFLLNKILAVSGMAGIMLASMGAFGKKGFFRRGGLKTLMQNLELKDRFAHLDVIKLTYGTILMGRLATARDQQELNATARRDYAGFLNWLVFGGFVAKGVAHLFDKSLINIDGPVKGRNFFETAKNWISNVSLKTPGEVKAMIKNLSEKEKIAKIAKHNGAAAAGLLWSMFALGIGMPLLNNYIINKSREKQQKSQKQEIKPVTKNDRQNSETFGNQTIKNRDFSINNVDFLKKQIGFINSRKYS